MEFSHELVLPNEDLPFRMFLFEGKDGNYVREKCSCRRGKSMPVYRKISD